jgi:hypothetical protein
MKKMLKIKSLRSLRKLREIKNPKKAGKHALISLLAGAILGAIAGFLHAAF